MTTRTLLAILAVPFIAQCDAREVVDAEEPLPETHGHGCDCAAAPHRDEDVGERLAAADIAAIQAPDAPRWGSDDARVTVVVFVDFSCPYCARVTKTLRALKDEYGDALAVVFRQKPLPFHPDAFEAAKAALAAGQQDAFDDYQASLYAAQSDQGIDALEARAAALGLDIEAFRSASMAMERRVSSDMELADRLGVRGTPTLFVNGRRITGAQPADKLRPLIDDAMR